MTCLIGLLIFVILALVLLYQDASIKVWGCAILVWLLCMSTLSTISVTALIILWCVFVLFYGFFAIPPIRRNFFSRYFFATAERAVPKLSKTEQEAIAAGTVSLEAQFFSGKPDWEKIMQLPTATLNDEEAAFLAGPVEELCCMINDWDITHNLADLPPEMWKFLKEQGFFGLIIPKKYGGKDFSAAAHSAIIQKVSACSITVASTVAVPNSLGPAELILKYGTQEQKDYYLPRLACGEEVPCFALTGPEAGSDASSMPDFGMICHGEFEGKKILGIRLNFSKRYITLAPIATVIGLAFKLYDPEHLLSAEEDLGITCALVRRETAGIHIGRRHFPLNAVFQNGPIQGKDVFIPLDWIIGGTNMAGHGWRMLVECLAVGRGITLPSMMSGGSKTAVLACGAYAKIREQFDVPIGYFGGVEEVLARIVGNAYTIDAVRKMTVGAIDQGEQPAILTAIAKYHTTTRGRMVANDAMDIHGGKGICLGPKNYLGRQYQATPISITVEGANILTRCMIIFGQGAMRCHPYALKEVAAVHNPDRKLALRQFDEVLKSHISFTISNMLRAFFLGLTGGYSVLVPRSPAKRYLQQLTRMSAAFALLADSTMLLMGGALKRNEKISARLGDILSLLYLGTAVIKHFKDQGQPEEDIPLLNWCCQDILFNIQLSIDQTLDNLPNWCFAKLLYSLIFPLGRRLRPPHDKLGHQVAKLCLLPSGTRQRLTQDLCMSEQAYFPLGRIQKVFTQVVAVEEIERRVHAAQHKREISGISHDDLINAAVAKGIITAAEGESLIAVHKARMEIIAVDDFDNADLVRK